MFILLIFLFLLTIATVHALEDNQNVASTENVVVNKTFESIHDTIEESSDCDTILLDGTYVGSGKRDNN